MPKDLHRIHTFKKDTHITNNEPQDQYLHKYNQVNGFTNPSNQLKRFNVEPHLINRTNNIVGINGKASNIIHPDRSGYPEASPYKSDMNEQSPKEIQHWYCPTNLDTNRFKLNSSHFSTLPNRRSPCTDNAINNCNGNDNKAIHQISPIRQNGGVSQRFNQYQKSNYLIQPNNGRHSQWKEQKSVHWSDSLNLTDFYRTSNSRTDDRSYNTSNLRNVSPIKQINVCPTLDNAALNSLGSVTSQTDRNKSEQVHEKRLSNDISTTTNATNNYKYNNSNSATLHSKKRIIPVQTNPSQLPLKYTPATTEGRTVWQPLPVVSTTKFVPVSRSQSLYSYLVKQSKCDENTNSTSTGKSSAIVKTTCNAMSINDTKDSRLAAPVNLSTVIRRPIPSPHLISDSGKTRSLVSPSSILSQTSTQSSNQRPNSIHQMTSKSITENYNKPIFDRTQLTVNIYQSEYNGKPVQIGSDTTCFNVLQLMLKHTSDYLTTKHALVERVPLLGLERCLEDDEHLLNYLLGWKTESEYIIFFEERQDFDGLFENQKLWLGERLLACNRTPIDNIFNKRETVCLPTYSENLYLRVGEMKWKKNFCLLHPSGLYFGKRKTNDLTALRRLNILQPNLYLYIPMKNQKLIDQPTPYSLEIRPHATKLSDSRVILRVCVPTECSWRIWYSLLRISLVGKRLYTNYQNRLTLCRRSIFEKRTVFPPSYLPKSCTSDNFDADSEHGLLTETISIGQSSKTSSIDYTISPNSYQYPNCYSVTDLARSVTPNSIQPNSATSLTSLTLYPVRQSNDKDSQNRGRTYSKGVKLLKKRIFGNGPSARRCTRSVSQISEPFNVTVPNWVRASYEEKINETAL